MSILIRGIEMPTSCDDCFLPLRYCPYAMKPNGECPIVPVPPHGRLIDADAVMNSVTDEKGVYVSQFAAVIGEAVDAAPTIIPAEEDGT